MKNRQQALCTLSYQGLRSEKAEYLLTKANYCSVAVACISFALCGDLKKNRGGAFCYKDYFFLFFSFFFVSDLGWGSTSQNCVVVG